MRRLKKISLTLLATLALLIAGGMAYLKFFLPDVGPAPQMKVDLTPERVDRGRYLAHHVSMCMDCHSKRDWSRFSGPIAEGTLGMGGETFDQSMGFPGVYYSANITPAGVGRYTDGELFRVITTGVTKEGKALFPVMPYHYYGRMDEEDIKSIIAYLRTLKPIENTVKQSASDFPMNFILNTFPRKASPEKIPPASDQLAYGRYMTNASGCMECHTKDNKGQLIAGTEFGGGRAFPLPGGATVRSSNISPDKATGIGNWTAEKFVAFFHSRSDSTVLNTTLKPGAFNSIMPWTMYGKMKEDDLRAIYTYLQTVKPIVNSVDKFVAAR